MTKKTNLKRFFNHLDNEGKEQAFMYAMLFERDTICKLADEFDKMYTLAENCSRVKSVQVNEELSKPTKNYRVNPHPRNVMSKGFITEVEDLDKEKARRRISKYSGEGQ